MPTGRGFTRPESGPFFQNCLHALRAVGPIRAVVSPRGDPAYPVPLALYRRLGFRPVGRTVTWTRGRQT